MMGYGWVVVRNPCLHDHDQNVRKPSFLKPRMVRRLGYGVGGLFGQKRVIFGLKRGLRGLISLIEAFICLSRSKIAFFGSKNRGGA